MKAQFATALKISENQIIRVEEWANVFFVVVSGKGGRFVSKKGIKEMTEAQEYINLCHEIADFDEDDLPRLTGSLKQVAWAESIRNDAMGEFVNGHGEKESNIEASLACGFISLPKLKKTWENVKTKTEAKFWIDNRHSIPAYRGR